MPGATASPWTELPGGIRVRQSRAFAMNSMLLLDPEHTVIVDPGVLPSEIDDLAAAVAAARPAQATLFLSHAHWDHVLGRLWWPGAEVIGHDRLSAKLRAGGAEIRAEAARIAEAHGERWARGFEPFRVDHAASGLHYVRRGPWHLVMRDAPGHSDSQLTLHLPDRRALFAADMLSDVEIPGLETAPGVYRRTLEPLRLLAEQGAVETLVPGHGAIARGRDAVLARFRDDLAYVEELDRRVLDGVRAGWTLEKTIESLDAMDYCGKRGGPFPMADLHRENVRVAWRTTTPEAAAHRSERRPEPR